MRCVAACPSTPRSGTNGTYARFSDSVVGSAPLEGKRYATCLFRSFLNTRRRCGSHWLRPGHCFRLLHRRCTGATAHPRRVAGGGHRRLRAGGRRVPGARGRCRRCWPGSRHIPERLVVEGNTDRHGRGTCHCERLRLRVHTRRRIHRLRPTVCRRFGRRARSRPRHGVAPRPDHRCGGRGIRAGDAASPYGWWYSRRWQMV